ncbi:MAG: helix-turn-helix domain-containing protein [Saprospiraceae bacterium]|nr:helix-turn-helix domain-containing protein [Saprospiraceae bacterium]
MLWTEFLFFFSALGVFNGILLVLYQLTIRRPRTIRSYLLGFLGLAFCIRVGVSCIYYFQKLIPWTAVQIGLSAHILIGPLLLAYIIYSWEALRKWRPLSLWILTFSSVAILLFGLLYPFQLHAKIWDYEVRYTLHAILSCFLLITTILLISIFPCKDKNRSRTSVETFSLLVYLVSILICGGFALSLYVDYVLGPIISSLLFYTALIYLGLRRRTKISSSTASQKMSPKEAKLLQSQLEAHLRDTHVYRNPHLTIAALAKELKWPKARLSYLLNSHLGLSFTSYINQFRIDEAKELLQEQQLLTIEAIGYEVGFGSRSSFFATFKQQTGLTPKKFQETQIK